MSGAHPWRKRWLALTALTLAAGPALAEDWSAYGHDGSGARFSPLARIDRSNVATLKPAWTFHTGDIEPGGRGPRSGFETNPIFVDGTLYITTPFNRVIALDPATGTERWAYDPKIDRTLWYGDGLINRGVAAWLDGSRAPGRPCRRRIFEATLDARLVALDAATGEPCADFGQGGVVSLRDVEGYIPGQYHMTSPPTVIDGRVIVGSSIDDNDRAVMPSGVVRAFDARTGALSWSWQPLQEIAKAPPGTPRRTGAGNAWTPMSVDPGRHRVFVATGSASPDFFGGARPGDNRWANSVVSLDARTGALVWGFQLVHHDLWDYDTAAQPVLAELAGRPVVIAGNKTGFVYVLDRDTGKPVLPVQEQPVPQSDVPGEATSPTQPVPTFLPPLVPQSVAPDQLWGLTDQDRAACKAWLQSAAGGKVFSPPSLKDGLVIPGFVGGLNWSGFAVDQQRGLLIAPVNNLPYRLRLIPRDQFGQQARKGEKGAEYTSQAGAPYGMSRAPWMGPSGLPCVAPPWGRLVALDLNSGVFRWQVPLGSFAELAPGFAGMPKGSVSLGGAIVTDGGVVFVAGTIDKRLRAFDEDTGQELWSAELPASAHALPMTYEAGGRQYVVIAAGGSAKITQEAQSDAVVAFSLP